MSLPPRMWSQEVQNREPAPACLKSPGDSDAGAGDSRATV